MSSLSLSLLFVVMVEERNSLSSSRLSFLSSIIVKGRAEDNSNCCFLTLEDDDDETVAVAVVMFVLRKIRALESHPLPFLIVLLSLVVEDNVEDECDEDDDVVE